MFFIEEKDIFDFNKTVPKVLSEMNGFVPYDPPQLLNNKWVQCVISKEIKKNIYNFSNTDLYDNDNDDNYIFEYVTLEAMDLTKSNDMNGYLKNPDESLNDKMRELMQNKGWFPLGSVMYMIDNVWFKGQPRYVQPFVRAISKTQQEEDNKAKEEKEREAKEEQERKANNERRKKAWEEQQKKAQEDREKKAKEEQERKEREEEDIKTSGDQERKLRQEAYAKIPVVEGCPSSGKEPQRCIDKKDYRSQTLIFHPDKNPTCIPEAQTKFQKLENIPECIKAKETVASGGKSKRKKMVLKIKIKKNKSIKNK